MARIFIEDGNRRYKNTGYAQLCRSIIMALHTHTDHQIMLRRREGQDYAEGIRHQDVFDSLPHPSDVGGADINFRVGPPNSSLVDTLPSILYTQNALGGLPSDWASNIKKADTLVVPGEFDRKVFAKHHDRVFTCPQVVDYDFFKPLPEFRKEGSPETSFLFVGSYGYRKGTDLVVDTVAKAFPGSRSEGAGPFLFKLLRKFGKGKSVHIHLHCFSGVEGDNLASLIESVRRLPANIRFTVNNRPLSPAWMRRLYNRFDCVFTLSRGEGWCMPLWEGLYCGLPVIAPDSTAMGEWLPRDAGSVEFIDTREVPISKIDDPTSGSIVKRYGEPGITLFEPDIDDAARAFRTVYDDIQGYKARALEHRDALARAFSLKVMADNLAPAIDATLAGRRG